LTRTHADTSLSSRGAKRRGICFSLALESDRLYGVASAARLLLLRSPRGAGARAPRARLHIGTAASKASSPRCARDDKRSIFSESLAERLAMAVSDISPVTDLDLLSINTIRPLAMDAVQKAESGHPGTPMALAPLGYRPFTRHMRHD